jgi:hypothetical protein
MDLTQSHVFVDGHLVSAKAQRIVQAIKDYEPELEVKWVPPAARAEGQAAYAIIHNAPGNSPYVLFYVQKDEDFDERVLAKIIVNDQRNGKQAYSDFEAWEQTNKLLERQAFLDKMEEAKDIAAFVAKTHLNTIRIDKNLTIRDYGDRVR